VKEAAMKPKLVLHSTFSLLAIVLCSSAVAVAQPATRPTTTDAAATLAPPFTWKSTGVLISPIADAAHPIISVKDPTVVRVNDRWHVYATTCDTKGSWSMVYLNFADWSDAATAKQYYVDANPNLRGYHCAPQVFYFTPQRKWYLIFQSQQPQFSTTDDLSKPETWTRPENFFTETPASVGKLWLDYWIICDRTHAYLFFTGDNGKFYRSRTTIEEFPKGMSEPVVVMSEPNRFDLFEGGATYRLKGSDKYLTMIEALGPEGKRYYRAYLADRLDGDWKPLAAKWQTPFASIPNVTFEKGVEPWTQDVSHGELIRDGYDESMMIDPNNLQFLYQGMIPTGKERDYSQLPYRIGLLRLVKR
jgi:hypothetical protein